MSTEQAISVEEAIEVLQSQADAHGDIAAYYERWSDERGAQRSKIHRTEQLVRCLAIAALRENARLRAIHLQARNVSAAHNAAGLEVEIPDERGGEALSDALCDLDEMLELQDRQALAGEQEATT